MKEKDLYYKVRNQLIDSGFFTKEELEIAKDIDAINKCIRAKHNNFDNANDWQELFDEAFNEGIITFDSRGVIK